MRRVVRALGAAVAVLVVGAPVAGEPAGGDKPLDVFPREAHVAPRAKFQFAFSGAKGPVRARLLDAPRGATLGDDGVFVAPAVEGRWHAVALDPASLREVGFTVSVDAKVAPLRPRAPVLALVPGASAPLEWVGGSGALDVASSAPGVRVDRGEGGAMRISAGAGSPREFDVKAVDRVTHAAASVHVVVATELALAPVVQGTRSRLGDVAVGDVNGDHRPDLVVGHAERAAGGVDAGGVLVFYGRDAAGWSGAPDAVIDGEHAGDRLGAKVVVADVTGDGIDDVVAAAPTADLGPVDRGGVYVFAGAKTGPSRTPARLLAGEGGGDRFGTAILVQDVDGDGTPDLTVAAPHGKNALSPCAGGRVYVYRGMPKDPGAFEALAMAAVDLRDPQADAGEVAAPCPIHGISDGAALAWVDVDGDGKRDLAVGMPGQRGAVAVYRGGAGGSVGGTPAWAIHVDRAVAGDVGFGGGLDVVPVGGADALVVRGTGATGGVWAFGRGTLGPAPAAVASGDGRTRVVSTQAARASVAGFSASTARVADVDGDGQRDYVVADARAAAPVLRAFHVADLGQARALAPFAMVPSSSEDDAEGVGIASWSVAGAPAEGLALFASSRTTRAGAAVGAVDVLVPGPPAPLADRLRRRSTLALPNAAAGDLAGSSVAFMKADARLPLEAIVSAPATARAPASRRFARFDFPNGAPAASRDAASTAVPIDFDGDGVAELAVLAPGSPAPASLADPDGCLRRRPGNANVDAVHIYDRSSGSLVERAIVPSPWGKGIAAGDFDGDHLEDLALQDAGLQRVAFVHGRPFVDGKVVVACEAEGGATYPPAGSTWEPGTAAQISAIGDVDRDGCEDLALTLAGGAAVVLGFDASGARCHKHQEPLGFLLTINDQSLHLWTVTSLANGKGDLDGDGVPDLVVGDDAPSVQIVSGAFLGSVCPDHVCPAARTGMIVADSWAGRFRGIALAFTTVSERLALLAPEAERRFGAALAVGDVDGDGALDLAIGAPDANDAGIFSGSVRVYRGPFKMGAGTATLDPWLIAFGDGRERGGLGEAVAVARSPGHGAGWLLAGAPRTTRGGVGASLGAGYLWELPAR